MIYIKKLLIVLLETTYKILWLLPINKKAVAFISFNGRQFSDSPKYLYNYLKDHSEFELWWLLEDGIETEEITRTIAPRTIKALILLATSKAIVTNNYLPTWLPVRKRQVVLNTWHGGGAYKKIGLVATNVTEYDKWFFDRHNKKYSAFVADSEVSANLMIREAFGFSGKILKYGLPRNAVLQVENTEIYNSVRRHYNIGQEILILYAPTFRGNTKAGGFIDEADMLDLNRVCNAVERVSGKSCKVLFRGHHALPKNNYIDCTDATGYPDMQELIVACDLLITDYSSCMWDAAIARKPVFIFAPDYDYYLNNQGFFTDPNSWPFTISTDNTLLENSILEFNYTEYKKEIEAYLKRMGSYESSESTELTGSWLIDEILGKY